MATAHSEQTPQLFACKCLNVRIAVALPPSSPPEYPRDALYTPVFVQDGGISVIHPQVTARVPSKSEPIPGSTRYSRFTVLTCLFCGLPVYRVHHTISPDVEGADATLLPSEDWLEHEIMQSATGWIDVHKDCITGDAIPKTQESAQYVPVFSLALPLTLVSPLASPVVDTGILTPQRSRSPEPCKTEYLSHLRPLFLEPPFTSSHPIFVHLAGLATQKSQELRAAAEQQIADFVTAEAAGIEIKEKELKKQVETLWRSFRSNVETVQKERLTQSRPAITHAVSRPSVNGLVSPSHLSSSVTIRDFTPQPISSRSHSTSISAPRPSALSASLATNKFYHPRALQEHSPSRSRSPSSNGTTSIISPRSLTSTLVPTSRRDGSSILQYAPNNDDTINTQASYRFFRTLDEDMARYKEAQKKAQGTSETSKQHQEVGPSHTRSSPTTNGVKKAVAAQETSGGSKAEGETTPSRGRDKGKRVTFVEPPMANGDKEIVNSEEPMVFPLDEELGEESEQSASNPQNTLPLLDQQITRPVRARNPRLHNNSAQEAFASLRPSSLPSPSHIRPMRSQPGVDSFSHSMILNLPRAVASNRRAGEQVEAQRPVAEHEAALLRLVAADTPSHRGAWGTDGKAWQTFTRRQDSKDDSELLNIPEEEDGEEDEADAAGEPNGTEFSGLPASMPVNIINRIKTREPLSLASYLPPSTVPEEPSGSTANPSLVPGNKPLSSAAIRKALYTQRDRHRAMDPGGLDFTTEEDDEEDPSEESEVDQPEEVGEKGRKHALKILQARNELPSEGMWRSLA